MKSMVGTFAVLIAASLLIQETAGFEAHHPHLFAEGVVSTPDDESSLALMPGGHTAYFEKSTPTTAGQPLQVICVTTLVNGRWTTPEIAPFSGRYRDMGPALAPDGSKLFFISDRPLGESAKRDLNIWVVLRSGGSWTEPQALEPPVNSLAQEYGVSVAASGNLYFSSNRAGGHGSFDVYRAKLENGKYGSPENLGEAVNTEGSETQPAISPDETMLVYTALGREDEMTGVHQEYNKGDLYISFRRNGVWGPGRNCGPRINSGAAESWSSFSGDGRLFFFSSERGFATYRPGKRLLWSELRKGLSGTLNGMGNIYQVDAEVLRNPGQ